MSYNDLESMMRDTVAPKEKKKPEQATVLDAATYTDAEINLESAAAVDEWIETTEDDLEDGETFADRFASLMIGIADPDIDGELTADDQEIVSMATEAAADYLSSQGVDDDDIDLLINDNDADAAERIQDYLVNNMEDGATFDSAAFDAAYKKKQVVRNGKKVWVKKRVSGTVRLSPKQKMALKKAQRKANSSAARMKRLKSNKARKKMGL
ncbi:MAG: hypothetical protein CMN80_03350 [Spongiibacter sp.]|uniref:hypothetical protein n=1 Tax=Spongiibacter sp. TaxID=2024860 RepID=UPI000C097DF1|nr:hypothetical protein [Spongiibacter sp.]MAK43176.1 hypothetical protein [Spongiibacter sp.]